MTYRKFNALSCLVIFLLTTSDLSGQEFLSETPDPIDPKGRYLFYLHGKIIEDQGLPAVSATFGEYRYLEILRVFRGEGFAVISEVRPKDTNPWAYGEIVEYQVNTLLDGGVPPRNITILGASKGAGMAVLISHRLKNPDLNVVLLAICSPGMNANWKENDICLWGRVLSIFDESDTLAGSCVRFSRSCAHEGLTFKEVRLKLGLGHGVLYQPLTEWIDPTLEWINP